MLRGEILDARLIYEIANSGRFIMPNFDALSWAAWELKKKHIDLLSVGKNCNTKRCQSKIL